MEKKQVLCTYATRQIDSNLFMASTVFNGLSQCEEYDVDMFFLGYRRLCDVFRERYAKYFRHVYYFEISESALKRFCDKSAKLQLIYSYYIHFLKDGLFRPFMGGIKTVNKEGIAYDLQLSFVPSPLNGFWGSDVRRELKGSWPLIQFWTDPLSLGRCNSISEIPWWRFMHRRLERRLLALTDKAVFCYPLLCEVMKEVYPVLSHKMFWSDVSYVKHYCSSQNSNSTKSANNKISIGLFGSYHSKVRDIRPLLCAIKKVPDITFIIRGDSDIVIDNNSYENLDIRAGRCPISEIEVLEENCDILLCLGGKSGITHPAGKVFYYADYEKPIVYIGDGEHKAYFRQYLKTFNRYIICDNEEQSIVSAIEEAIASLKDFKLTIPERLEPAVVARKIVEGV